MIDKFVKNLGIEGWIIENKVDMEMYDDHPKDHIMQIYFQHIFLYSDDITFRTNY